MARSFADTIATIPSLARHCKPGLQALRSSDRSSILTRDPRRLSGSVDIDTALEPVYPNSSRWDYCLGITLHSGSNAVIWIEVHPANAQSVRDMVAKSSWLMSWLHGPGKPLLILSSGKPDLRWVPTGRVAIRRGSKQHFQLAKAGIGFPERRIHV